MSNGKAEYETYFEKGGIMVRDCETGGETRNSYVDAVYGSSLNTYERGIQKGSEMRNAELF